MHTVQPAKTQIFAKPDKAETKTASGFILAEKSVDRPKTANVINVGKEVTDYYQNDTIIYKSYTTTEIKLNGEEYIMVDEQDVLGKVVEVGNG